MLPIRSRGLVFSVALKTTSVARCKVTAILWSFERYHSDIERYMYNLVLYLPEKVWWE